MEKGKRSNKKRKEEEEKEEEQKEDVLEKEEKGEEEGGESDESGEEDDNEAPAASKPIDARAKKLAELRSKLNEARTKNHAAVLNEHKMQSIPPSKLSDKQKQDHAAWMAKVDRIRSEAEARGEDPELYAMRSITAEEAEHEDKKQLKKKSGLFGWEVFSNDAQYRAHKKRVSAGVEDRDDEYEAQKAAVPDFYRGAGDLNYVSQPKVPKQNVDRMARDLTEQIAKRKKFSRRRAQVGGDVDYINDRNRAFNQRVDRAYSAYTAEIRQNLERGSAL